MFIRMNLLATSSANGKVPAVNRGSKRRIISQRGNLSSREELIYTSVLSGSTKPGPSPDAILASVRRAPLAVESRTGLKLFGWNSRSMFLGFGNQALTNFEWKGGRPRKLCPGRPDGEEKLPSPFCSPVARGISVINYVAFCRSHSGRWVDPSVPPQLTHALKRVYLAERCALFDRRKPLSLCHYQYNPRRRQTTWTMFNTRAVEITQFAITISYRWLIVKSFLDVSPKGTCLFCRVLNYIIPRAGDV